MMHKKLISLFLVLGIAIGLSGFTTPNKTDEGTPKISKIVKMNNGASNYIYNIKNINTTFFIPPKNFNPLEATDEQLQQYGFPPRPKDNSALYQWTEAMKRYKVTKEPKLKIVQIKKPNDLAVNWTNQTTPNWSGYGDKAGGGYDLVEGSYTQSAVISPTNSSISTWCGLGGTSGTKPLVQAGTVATISSSGIIQYTAWYEYILQYPPMGVSEQDFNMPISPGDVIYVSVSYTSTYPYFYVEDETTGQASSQSPNISKSTFYDGSSAEWIDERHVDNSGKITKLSNFGHINWTGCYSQRNNGTFVTLADTSTYPLTRFQMYDQTTYTLLAAPYLPSTSTSFSDYWYNSGNYNEN